MRLVGAKRWLAGSRSAFGRWALAGAGLDVYEHGSEANPDLRAMPNVVMLPHMGSATEEGRVEMGEKVIINVKTFADGHRPPDLVLQALD